MINGNEADIRLRKKKSKRFSLDKKIKKRLYVFFSLTAVVFILYLSSINGAFKFSDLHVSKSASQVSHNFSDTFLILRPATRVLTNLSYAFNRSINSDSKFSYYIFNVLVHIINSFLIFLLSVKILTLSVFSGKDIDIKRKSHFFNISSSDKDTNSGDSSYDTDALNTAFFTAILFAVHPIAIFSVTDIISRATLLSTMFILFSMIAFIDYTTAKSEEAEKKSLLYCIIFSILALLSKETAIVVLFLFFFFELIVLDMKKSTVLKRSTVYLTSLLVLETILLLLPSWFFNTVGTENGFSLLSRIFTQSRAFFIYLSVVIFPSFDRLSVEYDMMMSTSPLAPLTTIICIVLIAAALTFGLIIKKRNSLASFLIFWFLITLFAESLLQNEPIDLSRAYLASYSVIIIFSFIVMKIIKKLKKMSTEKVAKGYISYFIFSFIVIPLSFVTIGENRAFKTRVTLYEDALVTAPEKVSVLLDAGEAAFYEKEYKKAEKYFLKVLEKDDKNAPVHVMLANAYFAQNSLKTAESHYQKAKELDNKLIDPYVNLAKIYLKVGKKESSLMELKIANKIKPDYYSVTVLLSDVYFKVGDAKMALYFMRKSISLSPKDPELHYRAAKMYEFTDDYKNALKEYETVLDMDYDHDKKDEIQIKIKELIQMY